MAHRDRKLKLLIRTFSVLVCGCNPDADSSINILGSEVRGHGSDDEVDHFQVPVHHWQGIRHSSKSQLNNGEVEGDVGPGSFGHMQEMHMTREEVL